MGIFKRMLITIAIPFASIIGRFPAFILKIRCFIGQKRILNLKRPHLFIEKTNWLSLYSDTSLWSQLADKYTVRKYVEEKCGKEILNELYGVYQSPHEINYDNLPKSFVLKTTNGCANNIFVKDKSTLNLKNTNNLLHKWLKYPYGELTGQPHYAKIKPQIIAEKFLKQDGFSDTSLIDYKIYCINGNPLYISPLADRIENSHQYKMMLFDENWKPHSEFCSDRYPLQDFDRPESLNEMLKYAKILSQPFTFVRVDFYEIDKKPVFGEMTFTPDNLIFNKEFQVFFGDLINIK